MAGHRESHRLADKKGQSRLEARYANYFEVGHNAFEFIIDFGQYHGEDEAVQMQSRVVTGPAHAKILADMLDSSIRRYEEEHGTIPAGAENLDPLDVVQESIADFLHPDGIPGPQQGGLPRRIK